MCRIEDSHSSYRSRGRLNHVTRIEPRRSFDHQGAYYPMDGCRFDTLVRAARAGGAIAANASRTRPWLRRGQPTTDR